MNTGPSFLVNLIKYPTLDFSFYFTLVKISVQEEAMQLRLISAVANRA